MIGYFHKYQIDGTGFFQTKILAGKNRCLFRNTTSCTRLLFITAAVSGSIDVAENLLSHFVDIGNKEWFPALLYVCFDLLRPDVVEELSMQYGHNNFYMPYHIQISRTTRKQLASLEKGVKERSKGSRQRAARS